MRAPKTKSVLMSTVILLLTLSANSMASPTCPSGTWLKITLKANFTQLENIISYSPADQAWSDMNNGVGLFITDNNGQSWQFRVTLKTEPSKLFTPYIILPMIIEKRPTYEGAYSMCDYTLSGEGQKFHYIQLVKSF